MPHLIGFMHQIQTHLYVQMAPPENEIWPLHFDLDLIQIGLNQSLLVIRFQPMLLPGPGWETFKVMIAECQIVELPIVDMKRNKERLQSL